MNELTEEWVEKAKGLFRSAKRVRKFIRKKLGIK